MRWHRYRSSSSSSSSLIGNSLPYIQARKPPRPGGNEEECTFFPKTYWKEWLALQRIQAEKAKRRKEQEGQWEARGGSLRRVGGGGRGGRDGNNENGDDDDYHEELFDDSYVYQSHAGIWAA